MEIAALYVLSGIYITIIQSTTFFSCPAELGTATLSHNLMPRSGLQILVFILETKLRYL